MAHSHSHGHGHGHSHGLPASGYLNKAFLWGIGLNLCYVAAEAGAGWWYNSLALLTDAGHNFTDVISLLLAYLALKLAQRKPTHRFTYGFGKSTTLVSLLNAMLLLVAVGAIGWEAVGRLGSAPALNGTAISLVALVGIFINAGTALLFFRDKDHDINVKGAYLHMAADALVSLGVVLGGVIMYYTNWFWVDAVLSLAIMVVIVWSTWGLLVESLRLTLDAAPQNLDVRAIRQHLLEIPGVTEVHDLHVWAMSSTENSLTAHLVVEDAYQDTQLTQIQEELGHQFGLQHVTLQVERGAPNPACVQDGVYH
ncbi:cation diffusion facilitator family transporter [Rufibacter glacialis]|uniref:Cation diffusion facilitator family transporter n=1 Tax=Rufibacter glacialis TaxID=1259555 RepID=A0A5M8QPP6_9BACT|nr:cation diffusion facilitator family transporter [Rufibacter glacialis]KAA6437258.1 cation transporter [Rufibacter glacialis]GGK60674.1 cobalt transporter [Rufibacter glacialis]